MNYTLSELISKGFSEVEATNFMNAQYRRLRDNQDYKVVRIFERGRLIQVKAGVIKK